MSRFRFAQPAFEQVVVEDNLQDGYWIDAVDIDGDGRLDLIASGLAVGDIVWYRNPDWKKHKIATLSKPVAMDHLDVTGNGHPDLVVCHDYGECMYHCKPEDGKISWLRNPGSFNGKEDWSQHFVAELMATHRLRFGHFTQDQATELLALPVVGPQGGMEAVHAPIQVTLFRQPDDPAGAENWPGEVIDDQSFRIIHDVQIGKFDGSGRDSAILATEEGIGWLRFEDGKWQTQFLGGGEQSQFAETGFKGTGNVALGCIGDDPYAYIPTIEPFHGNTLAVYTKQPNTPGLQGNWQRTILDVFGDPNEAGEGPGHHVLTADFDGDGDDEFLVALRGPWPWQGVFYYKCVDVESASFVKKRVSSASAARIALGDFDGDGRPDFATTGYYTPGYFLCDDPQVLVFLNRTGLG
jgi:hypothetical protein